VLVSGGCTGNHSLHYFLFIDAMEAAAEGMMLGVGEAVLPVVFLRVVEEVVELRAFLALVYAVAVRGLGYGVASVVAIVAVQPTSSLPVSHAVLKRNQRDDQQIPRTPQQYPS